MDKNSDLVKRLSALGFGLFKKDEPQDANATLADVAKSNDLRLWEGFPVALANSAEKGLFDYNKAKGRLKSASDRANFALLATMSLALYKVLGLKFSWVDKLLQYLHVKEKSAYGNFFKKLKENKEFKVAGKLMSSQRLKTVFNNYFNQAQARLSELLSTRDEFDLEYALSQIFSPKQKELFLKKLRQEKLTKTEKEYFSRAVKKKVLALSNPQLQRLSQKLLE